MPKLRRTNIEDHILNQIDIDTFDAANETEQLALTVQKGDYCNRTDTGIIYMNKTGNNLSMSDWLEVYDNTLDDQIDALSSSTAETLSQLQNQIESLSSSTGGGADLDYVQEELTIDSDGDTSFTLSYIPSPETTLMLFLNGLLMENDALGDYTLTGTTITWTGVLVRTTDKLIAVYNK